MRLKNVFLNSILLMYSKKVNQRSSRITVQYSKLCCDGFRRMKLKELYRGIQIDSPATKLMLLASRILPALALSKTLNSVHTISTIRLRELCFYKALYPNPNTLRLS